MEKTFLYRWVHIATGTTGTRERKFLHEKAFHYCLEFWNGGDWQYFPVSTPDPVNHEKCDGNVYVGPFQYYS